MLVKNIKIALLKLKKNRKINKNRNYTYLLHIKIKEGFKNAKRKRYFN